MPSAPARRASASPSAVTSPVTSHSRGSHHGARALPSATIARIASTPPSTGMLPSTSTPSGRPHTAPVSAPLVPGGPPPASSSASPASSAASTAATSCAPSAKVRVAAPLRRTTSADTRAVVGSSSATHTRHPDSGALARFVGKRLLLAGARRRAAPGARPTALPSRPDAARAPRPPGDFAAVHARATGSTVPAAGAALRDPEPSPASSAAHWRRKCSAHDSDDRRTTVTGTRSHRCAPRSSPPLASPASPSSDDATPRTTARRSPDDPRRRLSSPWRSRPNGSNGSPSSSAAEYPCPVNRTSTHNTPRSDPRMPRRGADCCDQPRPDSARRPVDTDTDTHTCPGLERELRVAAAYVPMATMATAACMTRAWSVYTAHGKAAPGASWVASDAPEPAEPTPKHDGDGDGAAGPEGGRSAHELRTALSRPCGVEEPAASEPPGVAGLLGGRATRCGLDLLANHAGGCRPRQSSQPQPGEWPRDLRAVGDARTPANRLGGLPSGPSRLLGCVGTAVLPLALLALAT
mmetsp:Transcript_18439/g.69854  ORF Transcript_18439/g.69854 Transcript_18439/m.69854 type:complete len:523 (+) Transcript_18439:179-1747(+)